MAYEDLMAAVVIPMHGDLWVEAREDPMSIRERLKGISPQARVCVLNVDERLELATGYP
jgi:L-ascorbate metabolism protein UlaG (beta-lactamase superfamily)